MLDDFFIRALLAGLGLALVTGPAGCFVVWRRLAYFGETIAHSSLLGVALAIVLHFNVVIGILISAALVAFIIFYLDRRGTLPTDTLLGLLAHGGLALGLVILSFFPAMRIDLHALLFGDILAVSRTDLAVIWGGGAVALGVLWWLWRPLLAATVDPDLATVAGLKPERARLIFGLLVAAIIAVAIKIVGILLDRGAAGDPGGDGSAFRAQSRMDGRRRGGGGRRRDRGRALRVRNLGHALRPLHRRHRACHLHRDPHRRTAEVGANGGQPEAVTASSEQPSSSICTVTWRMSKRSARRS